jgi:hypothetical protein
VIYGVNQHRHPKNVGQQDVLLPPVVAHVPNCSEEFYALQPLLVGGFDVLDESMQVLDESAHHLAQTRVDVLSHARVYHLD